MPQLGSLFQVTKNLNSTPRSPAKTASRGAKPRQLVKMGPRRGEQLLATSNQGRKTKKAGTRPAFHVLIVCRLKRPFSGPQPGLCVPS